MNNKEQLEKKANAILEQIEKLEKQIHAIELEEAVAFFDDFAKDLPKRNLPVSPDQSNFSLSAWR